MPPAERKAADKGWRYWCRKRLTARLLLGYAAPPLLLTPAFVINSDVAWWLGVGLLMVTWTVLGTVPVPITWLLPFLLFPLAGITSVSDLADRFMEDGLVLLLMGMNMMVAASEQTALSSRIALYLIEACGFRLRGILLGLTGVTFLSAQLLMGGATTRFMVAVVEATMFELQHDIIAAVIAQRRRRSVRTTVGDEVVMTPVHVMVISPRRSPSGFTSPEDEEDEEESEESNEEEDMRPQVLVPSIGPLNARNPGAYYELHSNAPDETDIELTDNSLMSNDTLEVVIRTGTNKLHQQKCTDDILESILNSSFALQELSSDPKLIAGMEAVIPEIEENDDAADVPRTSPILKHRNTAKVFLLEAHRLQKIKKALLINVAHSSAVGCMASILGSTSGIYLRDYFHLTYGYDAVTALSWTLLGLPVATVSVLLCALITYFLFLRAYDIQEDGDTINAITEIIRKKRKFLGKLTRKEAILVASLSAVFVFCVAGRGITSIFGLQEQLSVKYAHESVNVFVVVVLLSFLPRGRHRSQAVLDWRHVTTRMSWRTLLAAGGGLSLAGAVESAGLSRCITEKLSTLDFLSPLQTQVVLILLTALLAEVNNNVVIARFLIPIASDIGVLTNVHPLYYALPVAMASCTPTILPTAAPSIAIVTSAMDIEVVDILYPGLAVKLAAMLLVLASVNTVGTLLFPWGEMPAWAIAKKLTNSGPVLVNASNTA